MTMPSIHPAMYAGATMRLPMPVTGDLDREAFLAWLQARPAGWTVPGESVSHNPLAAWWGALGHCLVQVGYERAVLNGGTVDEAWVTLGPWGGAFLDACAELAHRLRRNLTVAEVWLAVAEADWSCDLQNAPTLKLDRDAIRAETARGDTTAA